MLNNVHKISVLKRVKEFDWVFEYDHIVNSTCFHMILKDFKDILRVGYLSNEQISNKAVQFGWIKIYCAALGSMSVEWFRQ